MSFNVLAQQKFSLTGFVKDSIGKPIEAASVSIIVSNGAGIAFSRTDANGFFNFVFSSTEANLNIKVTMIGFQSRFLALQPKTTEPYIIQLKALAKQLEEITVRTEQKISMAGDTLKYHVKAFKDKNDRVLQDLLNRLPGIQTDEKGVITYNGRKISTLYLDGDDLLGGKYGLATNTIPVEAVEQVQVIERDQPIKVLDGYLLSDNVALNLKLTENAKTVALNSGNLGLGNKAYNGELNDLLIRNQLKSINSLKLNNIGTDLLSENADLGTALSDNNIPLKRNQRYLSMGTEPEAHLAQRYALLNQDFLVHSNFLLKFTQDWSLRLNTGLLKLRRQSISRNLFKYYLSSADTVQFSEMQDNLERLTQWQFQIQVERNAKNLYLKTVTRLEMPKWKRIGQTRQNENPMLQNQPSNYASLNNETRVMKAIGYHWLLQYQSIIQAYSSQESLSIFPGQYDQVVNSGRPYLALDQRLATRNFLVNESATIKAKYESFVISLRGGVSYEQNKLQSALLRTDSLNVISSAGVRFSNDNRFNTIKIFGNLAVSYKFAKGSISLEANPSSNHITISPAQHTSGQSNNYLLTNPQLEFRKSFRKYHELLFQYKKHTEFGQISDIYQGIVLINYRELNYNDTPLPKTKLNDVSLRYSYRKPIIMLFLNSSFSYENTRENFISRYTLDSGLTRTSVIEFPNDKTSYILSNSLSKYLFHLSTNISVNSQAGIRKGFIYYNDEISAYRAYNYSLNLALRKKIASDINVMLSGNFAGLVNRQALSDKQNLRNTTSIRGAKIEWQQHISNNIILETNYQWSAYRQSGQSTVNNQFFDLKLSYTFQKKKGYLQLSTINILNQKQYQQITATSNQLTILQIPLRSRTFLLSYYFSF
ncbi:TonB-dependent receptor [Pedobacter aquatilis]|uniref:TonB-dependent receptor n=1 Tax=Pedobacter aquatilis TaxID=351343 RepID=UPI00292F9DAE|nr:TonB-dependent receptor [Pedobacter aquatilis]